MSKTFHLQQCQLCDDYAVLRDSHIAPAFMERYIKPISSTKTFTRSTNFNWDSQSAYKGYFLCFDCEQRFSKVEDNFARQIFWPWVNDKVVHRGKFDWLEYFLVSITWRFGRYHERIEAKKKGACERCTSSPLQTFRDYLLGRTKNQEAEAPRLFYSYVETCNSGDEGSTAGPSPLFDYQTRCYDQQIAIETHGRGLAIYIKLPHFAIWHTVFGPEWVIDASKIYEIAVSKADFYARKQVAETTQLTKDRRTSQINKRTPQELEDFCGTDHGDNVRRAQLFLNQLSGEPTN